MNRSSRVIELSFAIGWVSLICECSHAVRRFRFGTTVHGDVHHLNRHSKPIFTYPPSSLHHIGYLRKSQILIRGQAYLRHLLHQSRSLMRLIQHLEGPRSQFSITVKAFSIASISHVNSYTASLRCHRLTRRRLFLR